MTSSLAQVWQKEIPEAIRESTEEVDQTRKTLAGLCRRRIGQISGSKDGLFADYLIAVIRTRSVEMLRFWRKVAKDLVVKADLLSRPDFDPLELQLSDYPVPWVKALYRGLLDPSAERLISSMFAQLVAFRIADVVPLLKLVRSLQDRPDSFRRSRVVLQHRKVNDDGSLTVVRRQNKYA